MKRHPRGTGQGDIGHPYKGVSLSPSKCPPRGQRDMSPLVPLCPPIDLSPSPLSGVGAVKSLRFGVGNRGVLPFCYPSTNLRSYRMPRKSAAAQATPIGESRKSLQPPVALSRAEALLFREIIAACDPVHFTQSDLPLLSRYVEAITLAEQAAEHLRDEGPVIQGRPSPWLTVSEKAIRAVVALSMRLRLSPQSRLDPKTAGRKPGGRPSAYELMDGENR